MNKLCIDLSIYDNKKLEKYCINIMGEDKIDKIQLISNYLLCHFSTRVGDFENKIQRMNIVKQLFNI